MKENLEKRYGFSVAFSMVVGIVIGIGIFFKAGQILVASNMNPKIAIAAWVLGGIISILSGLTAAEVGAAIPETGGMIAWIKRIYGERIAFLVGWAQLIIYFPALIGIIAYYFAVFTGNFLNIDPSNTMFLGGTAFLAITFLFAINIFTKNVGGKIQTAATAAKIVPLLLITIFGFISGDNSSGVFYMTEITKEATSSSPLVLLGLALVPIMFAFDGWIYVGTIAGDLKNVKRDLPRSIILGLGFIAVFYVALNLALLNVFTAEEIVQVGMFGVATKLFGPMGAKFIFLGIMISAFGGLNGMILASTRVPYTLAVEGHLPKKEFFAKIDDKHKQPINSSIVMFLLSVIFLIAMIVTENPDVFGDIPVALFWLFYCLVFLGLFILRKKEPNLERPYVVPFYPVVPILALIGGASIFVYAAISNPLYMGISVALTLTGLFVYRGK
ncbi:MULTISPECIES: APC family permease [Cetobacterium]|jgi:APA family basic amino acid/polyamine antiporter|uniref:Amino acid permease n=1 Tax=Candidatus Cetobacterium colombiensis TaxID=3073100 RepID=A0ABU4WAG4_9FUSO|nr:amino acid permease [Candidatus Cetobacterium colombiensis]MDX8335571.1 amino acid permease [Candidatus Cetobacterium colombiensis]